jgi:hypothetical protein
VENMIAGQQQELVAVDLDQYRELKGAQVAELRGLQSAITRGGGYAVEGTADEAAGGPFGDAGAEISEILKRIEDRLNTLLGGN